MPQHYNVPASVLPDCGAPRAGSVSDSSLYLSTELSIPWVGVKFGEQMNEKREEARADPSWVRDG